MMEHSPLRTTPRLAATLLLVRDDPLQVLMVRRNARAGDAFSSALVFPGGVVDPEDRSDLWLAHVEGADGLDEQERALRIAACRETFEEAGILLAEGAKQDCTIESDFAASIRAMGARLPLQRLVHYAHWITPEIAPRRFDTHFYLCPAPKDAKAICDGQETIAHEWVAPGELLGRNDAGLIPFPTRMNLRRLSESEHVAAALAAAASRPRFTVRPRSERRDGRQVVVIPAEAGYGVTEDWR